MTSGPAQGDPFGDNETGCQAKQGACGGITITLPGLPCPSAAQHRTHYQQQQWQQIDQAYPAQYGALRDRYDDFIADAGSGWVVYLELAGFAAKQPGQLARPATFAAALITGIRLAGLY
ncbi:MAG TPA: hypothetical protein VLS47_06630 [Gallionella sp.]|nr:hypothetical protein [Gallionella sp.]